LQAVGGYLLDIVYPVVSNICLPHIEQSPFLYAQPDDGKASVRITKRQNKKVPWQYFALFCVTGCLQSLHLPWYGFTRMSEIIMAELDQAYLESILGTSWASKQFVLSYFTRAIFDTTRRGSERIWSGHFGQLLSMVTS
jgi:hypothetical protein